MEDVTLTDEQAEKAWAGMKNGLIEFGVPFGHEQFHAPHEGREDGLKQRFIRHWTGKSDLTDGQDFMMRRVDRLYALLPGDIDSYYVGIRTRDSYPRWDFGLTRRVHEHILYALGLGSEPQPIPQAAPKATAPERVHGQYPKTGARAEPQPILRVASKVSDYHVPQERKSTGGFSYYALYRSGDPLRGERVEIGDGHTDFWGLEVYYEVVDPPRAIFEATGHWPSGTGSIMSMVAGFYAAGHQMRIEYAWKDRPRRVIMYQPIPYFFPLPVFFIYGLASARGEWGHLCSSLRRLIVPASRLKVLTATAVRYMRDPRGTIGLCIP